MFGSQNKSGLHNDDDTFVTGSESFVGFATPLKRLPNTSVNDARHSIYHSQHHRDHFQPEPVQNQGNNRSMNHENDRSMKYKFFDNVNLTPLGNSAVQLNRPDAAQVTPAETLLNRPPTDLFATNSEKRNHIYQGDLDIPIFSGGPILLRDYFPPQVTAKNRNPIVVPPSYKTCLSNGLGKECNEFNVEVPSGEWTSPVVLEALLRQVSKEQLFKSLWANVIRLFTFHMTVALGEYLYQLYEVAYHDENEMYRNTMKTQLYTLKTFQVILGYLTALYGHFKKLQWILIAAIFVNSVRLFLPQDQCKDLPLTNRQRELIGLPPMEDQAIEQEGSDSTLIIKQRLFQEKTSVPLSVPKYMQENELGGFKRAPTKDDSEVAIALKDLIPAHKLRRA